MYIYIDIYIYIQDKLTIKRTNMTQGSRAPSFFISPSPPANTYVHVCIYICTYLHTE